MAEARLKGKLTMDDSQFEAALRRATKASMAFSRNFAGAMKTGASIGGVALAVGVGGTAAAMTAAAKKSIELGGHYADLNKQTGASIRKLALWSTALDNAGVGGENLGAIINKMQKAIESGSPAFARLGLSLDQLRKLSPDEQLQSVGRAIASLRTPSEQTAASMEIFGRAGGKLLAMFQDPAALSAARDILGSMPEILEKNAGALDDVGDKFDGLTTKAVAFGVGLTTKLIPALQPLLDKLTGIDSAKIGEGLGKDLSEAFSGKSAIEGITTLSGKVVSLLTAAGISAKDAIIAALTKAFEDPITALQSRISSMVQQVATLTNPDIGSDLKDGIRNVKMGIKGYAADLLDAVGLEFLAAKQRAGAETMAEEYRKDNRPRAQTAAEARADILASGGPKVGITKPLTATERMTEAANNLKSGAQQALPNTTKAVSEETNKKSGLDKMSPQARSQLVAQYGGDKKAAEAALAGDEERSKLPPGARGPVARPRQAREAQDLDKMSPAGRRQLITQYGGEEQAKVAIAQRNERLKQAPEARTPSVYSEPNVRQPGKPRAVVRDVERSNKIRGAGAKAKEDATVKTQGTMEKNLTEINQKLGKLTGDGGGGES